MKKPVLRLEEVRKYYEEGGSRVDILSGVSAEFYEGELAVLLGKSGSGKTTLLNIISGVDSPDAGHIWINGEEISDLTDNELTLIRSREIGIVFQFFNLIPTLTAIENVSLPRELSGASKKESLKRAHCLLDKVNLDKRAGAFTDVLSGGEQQRVAIARSLINDPSIILADEPTGNLDSGTSKEVLELLLNLHRDLGKTMVVATHSAEIAEKGDTVYKIENGSLVRVS